MLRLSSVRFFSTLTFVSLLFGDGIGCDKIQLAILFIYGAISCDEYGPLKSHSSARS